MRRAVHFDAGRIGRGFIKERLHASGYEIVFADVNEERKLPDACSGHHCSVKQTSHQLHHKR